MKTGRVLAALVAPIIAMSAASGVSAQRAAAPANGFAQAILSEHNRARTDAGVPALRWSGKLAQQAQGWAERLAREGMLRHSSQAESNNAGENLWMGSAGYYRPETMISAFVDEKRHYLPGPFPRVSRTGRWEDVGHYTQVVWRDTREVGCAVARNGRDDFLVCRYWPAGNWMGQRPY